MSSYHLTHSSKALKISVHCKYHINAIIIDNFAEGDIVCKECGLVLSERNHGEAEIIESISTIKTGFIWEFSEKIKEICARAHLCEAISSDAIYFFKSFFEFEEIKSIRHDTKAAASIYLSAQYHKAGVMPEDITRVSGVAPDTILRYAEEISCRLKLSIEPIPPHSYLPKFCYALDLEFTEEKIATKIIDSAQEQELLEVRKNEHLAAVALFIAAHITGRPKTKAEITEICPIAMATFRRIYKVLYSNFEKLIPLNLLSFKNNLPLKI